MVENSAPLIGSVLIIEDDEIFTANMAKSFRAANFKVNIAKSAKDAFTDIFKSPPDLIVLDINLPDLDGFHLAKEIKRNMILRHIPLILLSGRTDFLEKIRSLNVVVDEYLVKPFQMQDLMIRAQLVLERSRINLDANPLTRLPGNRAIVQSIKARLGVGKPYVVGYADLNNFKAFNDKYGFSKGDEVIIFAAKVIVSAVQKFSPQDCFVGHVGGDDFVFICDYEKGNDVCQAIADAFDKGAPQFYQAEDREKGYIVVEDRRGVVSQFPFVSIAIGLVSDEGKKFANIGQVNHALTQLKKYAKSFQGSAFVRDRRTLASNLAEFTWGPGSSAESSKVLEKITEALGSFMPDQLNDIINKKQISVLFQPLIEMSTDDVVGHEGLVRGPAGTPLEFPDALFQTARNSNRVVELDLLCMKSIITSAACLQRGLKLFINVYPETLLEESAIYREILQNPSLRRLELIFELAGSHRASDAMDLFGTLRRIKEAGFKICVDSVLVTEGAGLRYLPDLQPDYVKLNMLHFRDMSTDFERRSEFTQTIGVIKQSGSQVICTKLESRADAFLAVKSGVSIGQGFLFARPAIPPTVHSQPK